MLGNLCNLILTIRQYPSIEKLCKLGHLCIKLFMTDEKELKDQRIPIMMTPSEVEAIDDWMFKNRIRSRGEAIRRLCKLSLLTERSDTTKAVDKLMDATMTLLEVMETMPSMPEAIREKASTVLARTLDVTDAQISDAAKTLPMTSGAGDIREDLAQVDRLVEFLRGKSAIKLIDETPGMRDRLLQRFAEFRSEREKGSGSSEQ